MLLTVHCRHEANKGIPLMTKATTNKLLDPNKRTFKYLIIILFYILFVQKLAPTDPLLTAANHYRKSWGSPRNSLSASEITANK